MIQAKYIAELDKLQKEKFVRHYGRSLMDPINFGKAQISRDKFVIENPKLAIWLSVAEIIGCLNIRGPDMIFERKKWKHMS